MDKVYFSALTKGFYRKSINKNIPEDAIEVTEERVKSIMDAQALGATLVVGKDGLPTTEAPRQESNEERRASLITQVKTEAMRRIELVAPIWKQLNAIRGEGEVDFTKVDALRARAAALEEQISKLDNYKISMFNPRDDQHWAE